MKKYEFIGKYCFNCFIIKIIRMVNTMLKRILKSHVSKYIALSLILCSTIYSTTFLSSPSAQTTTKETTNLSTIEISNNITD